MGSRLAEIVVEAVEPARLAAFWTAALGWQPTGRYQGAVEIAAPAQAGPSLTFVPAAGPKRGKNRLHLDLRPSGCAQVDEVARLLALGARRVDIGQGEQDWTVLADPEGNEFCVLRSDE